MAPWLDNGGLSHPASDGEQNRLSALPPVPLTTLWPALLHTQRTVSPTAMVSLAGANVSAPPSPTMTVCVRGPSIVVVVPPAMVVGVVAGQLPAPQASQQLGTVPMQAAPPMGGAHFAALDFTEHFVVPFALVR